MQNYPEIEDHLITYVMPFIFSAESADTHYSKLRKMQLGHLGEALMLKDDYSNPQEVWIPSQLPVHPDFHDHVGNILNGSLASSQGEVVHQEGFQGLPALKMSPKAIGTLNGQHNNLTFSVSVSKSAASRLGRKDEPVWLPLTFKSVRLVFLGTEVGALIVNVQYRKPSKRAPHPKLTEIFEMTAGLARLRTKEKTKWAYADSSPASEIVGFEEVLKKICTPLFCDSLTSRCELVGSRDNLFTYSAVVLKDKCDSPMQARELALRLAKRYTSDYLPEPIDDLHLSSFSDVHHSAQIEGGSVLVEATRSVEILKNFAKGQSVQAYLPIALVAYLEFLALTGMSQGVAFPINLKVPTKKALQHSVKYTRRLFNFRLNYRFSQVSHISTHNQVFLNWRTAFQIDRTLEEVTADVNEISSYLEQLATQRREKFERDISAGGLVFASIFAVDEIFKVDVLNLLDGVSGLSEWMALLFLGGAWAFALSLLAKNYYDTRRG